MSCDDTAVRKFSLRHAGMDDGVSVPTEVQWKAVSPLMIHPTVPEFSGALHVPKKGHCAFKY